jgi:hypothetical protein
VTETFQRPSAQPSASRGLTRLGRYLVSPLRRLLATGEDPQARRAAAMTDGALADALEREVFAAQNADDEIWIEGLPLVQEAARRLRIRDGA